MSRRISILFLALLLIATVGCRQQQQELDTGNAVYYWRTDLRLDSTERQFLTDYHIRKIYCRYFDVVMNESSGEPSPNATIILSTPSGQERTALLPDSVELVPTIFITEDCMHTLHEGLAAKIVERIRQMNETHHINNVREIQMDCDFTARSRDNYYKFLQAVAREWSVQGATLSTTIRLHQLSMPAPPVDYGVLMIYNTGDPRNFAERNPVLDYRDVYPYLDRLDRYPLPLAAAYPVYQWVRHIHGVRVEHNVEASEILRVKQAVEQHRPSLSRAVITYHLDRENINRYNPETYEAIYHH